MINWQGRAGKYLNECGFNAFEFGTSPITGLVDVETANDMVCDNVSLEAQKQISAYLNRLEQRVQAHIDLHYGDK